MRYLLIIAACLTLAAQEPLPSPTSGGGSSSGGGTNASALTNCKVTATATVLTVGADSTATAPCALRVGTVVFQLTAPATATITGGSGSAGVAKVYRTGAGAIVVNHPTASGLTVTDSNLVSVQSAVPALPDASNTGTAFYIADVAINTSGQWTTVTDYRSVYGIDPIICGNGLLCTPSASVVVATIDPAITPTLAGANVWAGSNVYVSPPTGVFPTLSTQGVGWILVPNTGGGFGIAIDTFNDNHADPFYVQFVMPANNIALRNIQVRVSGTTPSGSAGSVFGIMDSSCALIANSTARILNATTGILTFNFASPPTLTAGTTYIMGFATEQSGVTFLQISNGSGLFNETSFLRFFTGATDTTGTGVTLALPASCGAKTFSATLPIATLLLP